MYNFYNHFLPPAMNDLYIYHNDVHNYCTRQNNICIIFIKETLMFIHIEYYNTIIINIPDCRFTRLLLAICVANVSHEHAIEYSKYLMINTNLL